MELRKKHGLKGLAVNFELIKDVIESKNGEIENWNSLDKILIKCRECSHKWRTSWNVIQSGHWCVKCSRRKYDAQKALENNYEEEVRKLVADKGGELDPDWKYTNNHDNFWITCNVCHHRWTAFWNNLKGKGSWCPYCNKHTVDEKDVVKFIENKGGTLPKNWKFISSKEKFDIECKRKHHFRSCWDKISADHWCPFCYGNNKTEEAEIRAFIESKKGILDSDWDYNTCSHKFWVTCKRGHRWHARWNNLTSKGCWCPHCRNTKSEDAFRKFMEEVFSSSFLKRRLKWLRNPLTGKALELDGYNQKKKIAFEYQGPFHYRELCYKDKNLLKPKVENQIKRDEIKVQKCLKRGIILIVMPHWIPKKNWKTEIMRQYNNQLKPQNLS